MYICDYPYGTAKKFTSNIFYGGSKMGKKYVVTNPQDVVDLGFDEIRGRIDAGKYEVECDIAALIYYPCVTVGVGRSSCADITAAFEYPGLPSKDGLLTFRPERLIKFFRIEKIEEDVIYIRFNCEYEEGYSYLEEKIRRSNLKL